jgi:hypothetical protein
MTVARSAQTCYAGPDRPPPGVPRPMTETADTGFMLFGTEKFMNLFEELSARLFVFVEIQ